MKYEGGFPTAQQEAKSLESEWFELLAVEVEEEYEGTASWRHSMASVLSSGTSIPAMRHPLLLPIAALPAGRCLWTVKVEWESRGEAGV